MKKQGSQRYDILAVIMLRLSSLRQEELEKILV